MKKPTTPLLAGHRPVLSILTPCVPSRWDMARALGEEIQRQSEALHAERLVEHLIVCDNWNRSIGEKRGNLLQLARGRYVAFCDDDDRIRPEYLAKLLAMAKTGADVLTFRQRAVIDGREHEIVFRLNHPDEVCDPGRSIVNRGPWHVCAWKRDLVQDCVFPHINYGEDAVWSVQARRKVRTEAHYDGILHDYIHDKTISEALPVG